MKVFTSQTQQLGKMGEDQAVRFLKKSGYSIIERNVGNRFGEIDIVAKKKGLHYFFEVKSGKQGIGINPAENLTKAKLSKLFVSVEYYCLTNIVTQYRVQGIIVLLGEKGECHIETIELF